jgi:hypothetical protein
MSSPSSITITCSNNIEDDEVEEPLRKRLKRDANVGDGSSDAKKDDVDFTLHLADDQVLVVTKSESQKLQSSCAFFRNAFRHGTKECARRILKKPDWTLEIAHSIMHVLLHGTLSVPHNYEAFKEAADQLLLPIRVSHPVSGRDIQDQCEMVQLIADTCKTSTCFFTMDMTSRGRRLATAGSNINANDNLACNEVWNDLLRAGTVFVAQEGPHKPDLRVTLTREDDEADNNNADQEEPPTAESTTVPPSAVLAVGSFAPLPISVYHTCNRLSESLRSRRRPIPETNNWPACMALPLYLGGRQCLQEEFPKLEFLTIETTNVPSVLNMTRVTAPFKDLQRVLNAAKDLIAPVHLIKLCYLLLPDPSVSVLAKLIDACQQCPDNPGTMGWDLEKNQFCTLKTLADTHFILDALALQGGVGPLIHNSGTIRLVTVDMTSAPAWSAY